MATQLLEIPLTRPPFALDEYRRRQEAVLARVAEAGLDALLVTANTHQEYLGGYDGGGSYFRPFPIVVAPGHPLTHVVRRYDEDAVRAESVIPEIIPYTQQRDFGRTVAGVLRGFGLERSRIGLELDAWQLAPADVAAIQAELPDATFVDATRIVARVAAVKSPVEIEAMRASMAGTDAAVRAFWANIVEHRSEVETSAAMDAAIRDAGCEVRSYTLVFGARTALPHGGPKDYRLERNQPAFTEVGALKHGYAAGLCRSAVLGSHPGAEALYALAEEALEAAIAAIRPGVLARDVDAPARAVFKRADRTEVFRHRTGYQTGIAWSDRGNLSLDPDEEELIEENMTLHMPIIVFEQGKFGVGTSENVLVTNSGGEILSSTPHTLFRAD
jgi:Xaa-Pro aminopeptidase